MRNAFLGLEPNTSSKMDARDNTLGISWHDSACIPNLNPSNIMDYFSERSNPFYDRTCNNEIVKMQRLSSDQLSNMTGLEYILLHCQEPILYVVRKQHRHSTTEAIPLTDYYIIAGVVYQAPDLGSVINSRILSAVHHIQGAFDKTQSFSRYQPSKGYCWDFKEQESVETKKQPKDKGKEEPSSVFQRQRVDMLLVELTKKYPPKVTAAPALTAPAPEKPPLPQGDDQSAKSVQQNPQQLQLVEPKVEIKQEKTGDGTSSSAASVTTPSQAGAAGNNNSNKSSSSSSSIKPPVEKRPRLMA